MRTTNHHAAVVLLVALTACDLSVTPPPELGADDEAGVPITTFNVPASGGGCPAARAKSVLVDATHDGGVWWFPQAPATPSGFNPDSAHQGRALANYLRDRGYTVTELGRGAQLPTDSMLTYATVIRAGYYYDAHRPGYSAADLAAYRAYVACPRSLLLLSEFLRDGRRDVLADSLGVPLKGLIGGTITDFTAHALTADVDSVRFGVGSYLESESNPAIQVLGRLPTGEGVMGVLAMGEAKVFWIGDTNGVQWLPQPFIQNLVAWGFR